MDLSHSRARGDFTPTTEPGLDIRRILDCYHDPLFAIDGQRRVLFRNAAAARVLRARSGFAVKSGQLMLKPAAADEAFRSVLQISASQARATQPVIRGIRVPRPRSARDWLVLVRPMDARTPTFSFRRSAGRGRAPRRRKSCVIFLLCRQRRSR